MEMRIYYDDTDAGGVVYHANYLKYFERGRTEYMLQRGLDPADMNRQGQIFVIVSTDLSFLAPARLGDTIIIETFLDEISHATIVYSYKIFLKNKGKENSSAVLPRKAGQITADYTRQYPAKAGLPEYKLLVIGKTKLAMVNPQMKVQRFSPDFIKQITTIL